MSGQQIGTVVGTVVGAYFGYPQLGAVIGGAIGGAVDPTKVEGPKLSDLRVTGTEYGQPIPWVAGSPRVAGQIIWASDKHEHKSTEGGKGGGPQVSTYSYTIDLLILLTDNITDGVSRVWLNNDLVYDGDSRKGTWSRFTVYTGAADQDPDPTYEDVVGAANAPAYRGRTTVFIEGLSLGSSGVLPNLTFEVNATSYGSSYGYPGIADSDILAQYQGSLDFTELDHTSNKMTLTFDAPYSGNYTCQFFATADWTSVANFAVRLAGAVEHIGGTEIGMGLRISNKALAAPYVLASTLVNDGLEHHYAFVRVATASDICYFYLDGVLRYSNNLSFSGAANSLSIAPDSSPYNDIYDWRGTIRDAIVTRTVEYPGGTTFTPPTVEYPVNTVDSVVTDLMLRAGYSADDFDVTGLYDITRPVRALAVSQVVSTRQVLEILMQAYFFTASKSDKIYFRARAGDAVATLSADDLGTSGEPDSAVEPFALTVVDDIEIPSQVALTYANISADQNTGTELSDRLLGTQRSTQTAELPLGLLPAEARQIADAMVIDLAAARMTGEIALPLEYAWLEPSDVVNIPDPAGNTWRMRIARKTETALTITCQCVMDDQTALDSVLETADDYTSQTSIDDYADTLWENLDVPLLADSDDAPGWYVAMRADTASGVLWPGASYLTSLDTATYTQRAVADTQSVFGTCSTTLGNWSGGNVFDESNSVTVDVGGGELASSTRAAMLLDLTINTMLVGSEVIRFRDATLVSAGVYTLTGLIRGCRGTEAWMTSHAASERCVLFDTSLARITDQLSNSGITFDTKAVTLGLPLSGVTAEAFANANRRLVPFSPAQARALASGTDLAVTWQRRTRLSYRYGGTSPVVPLGEASEAYRLYIYDGATLVRTEDTTAPSYIYTAANIAADGFSSTDTITFKVAQVSARVGDGDLTTFTGIAP